MSLQTATFGAGCFWCIETIFSRLIGVESVISGYTGGDNENPTYDEVCSGASNHAEVVKVSFDPNKVSYETLLQVFFAIHDPTTLNRQGHDVGSQYRSVAYFENDEQKNAILKAIEDLTAAKHFPDPIVTEVSLSTRFYSAESYHQNYYENNQENRYCQLVVAQKLQKFLVTFSHLLKDED